MPTLIKISQHSILYSIETNVQRKGGKGKGKGNGKVMRRMEMQHQLFVSKHLHLGISASLSLYPQMLRCRGAKQSHLEIAQLGVITTSGYYREKTVRKTVISPVNVVMQSCSHIVQSTTHNQQIVERKISSVPLRSFISVIFSLKGKKRKIKKNVLITRHSTAIQDLQPYLKLYFDFCCRILVDRCNTTETLLCITL